MGSLEAGVKQGLQLKGGEPTPRDLSSLRLGLNPDASQKVALHLPALTAPGEEFPHAVQMLVLGAWTDDCFGRTTLDLAQDFRGRQITIFGHHPSPGRPDGQGRAERIDMSDIQCR